MIVVHLLLFSVLLYNTEALFDDDKTTTVRSTAIKVAIPVENATTINRTETIGWYYGSGAVEKNTTDGWSYESGVVEKNETRDYKSVPVKENRPAPVTEITDGWSYESGAVEKNETRNYKSVPVENVAVVSGKEPAHLTYEFAVTKPYEDDVGYLTVDNGILTAHFPKKENEKRPKQVGWRNWHNSFYGPVETTTSTRRPYYSFWYNELENLKTTTESSYYRYDTAAKDSETTTTRRPYYSYWDKETDGDKSKTAEPYYGYNKTVVESETTTTRRPYYWYWNNIIGNYKNMTETSYYRYNQTETTTTRRPYSWYWDELIRHYKSTTETSDSTLAVDWYNHSVNDTETTWYNKRVESPFVNRANSSDQNVTTDQVNPKTSPSRLNPVNISINSSINANEASYYGTFTDFLKKIKGYILTSVNNIAPNSNITNLNVINGNGNMFFSI